MTRKLALMVEGGNMKTSAKRSAKKRIKDLPENMNLGGVKFHDPKTGTTGYWCSQWHKGIWYRKDLTSS